MSTLKRSLKIFGIVENAAGFDLKPDEIEIELDGNWLTASNAKKKVTMSLPADIIRKFIEEDEK